MILYGASGHCKVVIESLKSNGLTPEIIFDDFKIEKNFCGIPLKKPERKFVSDKKIIITIGDNPSRKLVHNKLVMYDKFEYYTLSHPSAVISPSSEIMPGTVLMPGAVVNAECKIGLHCILNTNSSVDHESILGDFVHVSPNAVLCGLVTVGEGTHIGAGAVLLPGINVGRWCKIGAGTVVIRDVPDFCTVVGNPGRIIKQSTPINI